MSDIRQQAATLLKDTPNPGILDVLEAYYRLSPLGFIPIQFVYLLIGALLLVIVFRTRSPKAASGNSILLTGPSDAGKTAIQCELVYGTVFPTHTSLQPTESLVTLGSSSNDNSRTAKLIDIPGHPRLRDRFKEYLLDAKAVCFVVDATTIARNGPEVAEHLHHILHAITSLPPSKRQPSLAILAHKYDRLSSTSSSKADLAVSRVCTILERELEKRRTSQKRGVGVGQLGDEDDSEMGGLECTGVSGQGFKFQHWEGGEIQILGTAVNVDKMTQDPEKTQDLEKAVDGLANLRQWLDELP